MNEVIDITIQAIETAIPVFGYAFLISSIPDMRDKVSMVIGQYMQDGWKGGVGMFITTIVGCLKCNVAWATIILTGSVPLAGIAALVSTIIKPH